MQNQLNDPTAPLPILTEIIGAATTSQLPLLTDEIGDAGTGTYPVLSEEVGNTTSQYPPCAVETDTTAPPTGETVLPTALPDEATSPPFSIPATLIEKETTPPGTFAGLTDEEDAIRDQEELVSQEETTPTHFSIPAGLMDEESLPAPYVELIDEQEISPPPAKNVRNNPVPPASEEQVKLLMQQLEVHLETVFISKLNSQLAQLQRLAVDLAVSEFKAELPQLLREALNKTGKTSKW